MTSTKVIQRKVTGKQMSLEIMNLPQVVFPGRPSLVDLPEVPLLGVLMLVNVDDLGASRITRCSQGLVLGLAACEVQERSSQPLVG